MRSSLSVREEELKAVKKENRKRRKVIEAYQEMMSAGATGLHTVSMREYYTTLTANGLFLLFVHYFVNRTALLIIVTQYEHRGYM